MFKREESKPKIVFAAATVGAVFDGIQVSLREGDPWLAEDDFVQNRPDLFENYPSHPRGTLR